MGITRRAAIAAIATVPSLATAAPPAPAPQPATAPLRPDRQIARHARPARQPDRHPGRGHGRHAGLPELRHCQGPRPDRSLDYRGLGQRGQPSGSRVQHACSSATASPGWPPKAFGSAPVSFWPRTVRPRATSRPITIWLNAWAGNPPTLRPCSAASGPMAGCKRGNDAAHRRPTRPKPLSAPRRPSKRAPPPPFFFGLRRELQPHHASRSRRTPAASGPGG